VVSVGYFVAGFPGAVCGWLAMVTPAFLIIPMLRYAGRRAEAPRVRGAVNAVTLAAAGLIVSSAIPLARQAITGRGAAIIAVAACAVAAFTRVDTLWVILGAIAAAIGFGWMGW
jgi:chromate transporter